VPGAAVVVHQSFRVDVVSSNRRLRSCMTRA
jgi:hypothetical protein